MIAKISDNDTVSSTESFLVCGLGSLGQHCVKALSEFGVPVFAIEQQPTPNWEIEDLPELLTGLIIGDCRHHRVLRQTPMERCRAALIVTSNEKVNLETALAIRQLNSDTRLVVRSSKVNLNQLLTHQLGNFIAFDPTELPASAFALAALGTEILGLFELQGEIFRVYQKKLSPTDSWCNYLVREIETHQRKVLAHCSQSHSFPRLSLARINYAATLAVGDTLAYVETSSPATAKIPLSSQTPTTAQAKPPKLFIGSFLSRILVSWWQSTWRQRIRRLALIYLIVVFLLLAGGTLLFSYYYPGLTPFSAFLATAILLLGGYGDLFSEWETISAIPWGIKLFSLGLTVIGTAFVGVLYALLTDALLSSRWEFRRQRTSVPLQDHVVVIGMGRVGQKVARLLQQFQQPLVGITSNSNFYQQHEAEFPLILAQLTSALPQVRLETAKSAVIVTDDEILNLEVALTIQQIKPQLNLVIRTSGLSLSQQLNELLPQAQVLGVYPLTALVFAGAAFGENILSLFPLGTDTILVTEYQIEAGDTLIGLMLADVIYGYGVIPIVYQKHLQTPISFPSDDFRLHLQDRLVVLATLEGLKRIEQGKLDRNARCWRIKIDKALSRDAVFEGANVITRISGCSLAEARNTMSDIPAILPTLLYRVQAERLIQELKKVLVFASFSDLN